MDDSFSKLTPWPVIDSHVHVFPDRLFQAVKRWFESHAWSFCTDGTAESYIGAQFEKGAAGLVLLPYAHQPGMARDLNRFVADLVRKHKGVKGLAAIHPLDENPREILTEAFEVLGLVGVKLHCHVMATAPDDPAFFPTYEAVSDFGKILVTHAGREPSSLEYGLDVRAICGAKRMEKVLDKFPDMTTIVPHLGYDEPDQFYEMLDRFPNLYLDTAMMLADFFPVSVDRQGLIDRSDRILYGTDYPHIPYPVETELQKLMKLDLGAAAEARILFENAARLYGFDI